MNTPAGHAFDLSVVIGTAHPGDDFDRLMAALLPQIADVRGELVLCDGTPEGLPTPFHEDVVVHHLRDPGADVFELRVLGTTHAQGWVIAYTEDHCVPEPGWCLGMLDAHRSHGHSASVSGATVNGTTATLWDRASFLFTFATVLPPLPQRFAGRVPPPANISLKHEVLGPYELSAGFLEFELMPHLTASGNVAPASNVVVAHHQAGTARWFLVHHFHNGRTTAGLLDRSAGLRTAMRRIGATLALTPRHLLQTIRELRARPGIDRADLRSVPLVGLILIAHSSGQLVGMFLGPGASPKALA